DLAVKENAAMAAGFRPLRDDGVAAARFQPARLLDRGRRDYDAGARLLHAAKQALFGQAEVEAHHFGPQFLHDGARGSIERVAPATGARQIRFEPQLGVVGRKPFPPGRLARGIRLGLLVAEEVQVDRTAGALADDAEFTANL